MTSTQFKLSSIFLFGALTLAFQNCGGMAQLQSEGISSSTQPDSVQDATGPLASGSQIVTSPLADIAVSSGSGITDFAFVKFTQAPILLIGLNETGPTWTYSVQAVNQATGRPYTILDGVAYFKDLNGKDYFARAVSIDAAAGKIYFKADTPHLLMIDAYFKMPFK